MPQKNVMRACTMHKDKSLPRFIVKDAHNLTQEFDRLLRKTPELEKRPRPKVHGEVTLEDGEVTFEDAEQLLLQTEFRFDKTESTMESTAHSYSRKYLLEGLRRACKKVEGKPSSLLAHSLSHQTLVHGITKILQSESKSNTAKDPTAKSEAEVDLLSLILSAQNIIAKHQESRLASSKRRKSRKGKNNNNVKSLFSKCSNIEAIAEHEPNYQPLQLPPFKPSLGPNLSRYKASCKGEYARKRLVDKHGTGIGTAMDSPSKVAPKSTRKATVGWPSAAIQEAARSWAVKQEGQRQQQHMYADTKKTTLDVPLQMESYVAAHRAILSTVLSRLDLAIAVTHCSECHAHMTLRHHEARYENEARYLLHDLVGKCVLWRVPFRVGAVTLKRNTAIALRTNGALARVDSGEEDKEELVPLLLAKCCSSVPVGSLEVVLAIKDENSQLHYQTLHSKLETQKFPSQAVLARRLRKALTAIMGHDPAEALESFLESKDKLQLSVPVCAYPSHCSRGCKPHTNVFSLEDLRNPEEVELYVASSLEDGLSVQPPRRISWVADFSLESKSHMFSVGELIDVLQVSRLVLSPRRRSKHKNSGMRRKRAVPTVPLSHFALDRFALHPVHMASPTHEELFATPQAPIPSSDMRPKSASSPTKTKTLSTSKVPSPSPGTPGDVSQVYSPLRTPATLRSNSGFNCHPQAALGREPSPLMLGLDNLVPFSHFAAVPVPVCLHQEMSDDPPPFKVSRRIDYSDYSDGFGAKHNASKPVDEIGRETISPNRHVLWYSQGFLRGVIKSAHKDGTYDVAYLPEKDGGDVYVANSLPMHASFNDVRGFVDVGVPQLYVTTVRDRHQTAVKASQCGTSPVIRESAPPTEGTHFVFTYSDSSLLREVRPWRSAHSQMVRAVQELMHGDYIAESAEGDGEDSDDFGDPDTFLRAAYVSAAEDIDQREDTLTPAEYQAYHATLPWLS